MDNHREDDLIERNYGCCFGQPPYCPEDGPCFLLRTRPPTRDIVEAWQKLRAGMERFGMESTCIETLDEYFENVANSLKQQERK